ncbi:MAG: succinate dehydrogenase assembly factor 2 [Gammaproteobacteria bacterium]
MPYGQVRWRARRGRRELDMLLERYLDTRYARASASERKAFAELLDRSDPDISDWIMGRAAPPAELSDVIHALAAYD